MYVWVNERDDHHVKWSNSECMWLTVNTLIMLFSTIYVYSHVVNYTDIVFSPHGSLLFEFEIATTINFDT
jgi:hypothetical protein